MHGAAVCRDIHREEGVGDHEIAVIPVDRAPGDGRVVREHAVGKNLGPVVGTVPADIRGIDRPALVEGIGAVGAPARQDEAVEHAVGVGDDDVVGVVRQKGVALDFAAENRGVCVPVALVERRHAAGEAAVERHALLEHEAVRAGSAGCVRAGRHPDLRGGGRGVDRRLQAGVGIGPARAVIRPGGRGVDVDHPARQGQNRRQNREKQNMRSRLKWFHVSPLR